MKNLLSLSILLVTVCLLLSIPLEAQVSKTVNVATAGTLPTLIAASEKDQITHLTLTGNLNGTDIRFIREMAERDKYKKETSGKLSVLDLSQANIVSGGGYYYNPTFFITNVYLDIVHNTAENIIDNYAFQNCTGLTEIILPASITYIGKNAFESCKGLTSITIPDNVITIDDKAFSSCVALTSVNIGNNVTSIGNGAFMFCKGLTSVTLPASITYIGKYAFERCSGLISISIGSGVTSIGNTAFSGCKRLKEFRVSEDNTSYCQLDGALYSKDKIALVACPATKTNEYIIPNSVTSIENGAFASCAGLTSITIPNSVTSIGEYAFSDCGGLTSITIPNSVTSIGNYAFSGCDSLTSITIPNSVTSIGNYAFAGCVGLTSFTIPNRITSIGNGAFSNCVGLTSITIPNSVTSIGSYAFSRSSFMEIHCEALIPPTLGRSDPIIFDNFSNDNNDAYYAFLKTCKIYVPKGTAAAYKNAGQWKKFSIIIEE